MQSNMTPLSFSSAPILSLHDQGHAHQLTHPIPDWITDIQALPKQPRFRTADIPDALARNHPQQVLASR